MKPEPVQKSKVQFASTVHLPKSGGADPKRRSLTLRRIVGRTRGVSQGPITRLFNPNDLGELIKPFVLLDYFDVVPERARRFGIHPHSGIATFTLLLSGNLAYEDTTGKSGQLTAGSLEWMRASAGVWHDGYPIDRERVQGLQLWVALPPELEEAPPESQYITPQEVQEQGPARIALGRHGNARSQIRAPNSINYLHVRLKEGERWLYEPPAGHEVAWMFPFAGRLELPDAIPAGELVVFEESNAPLEFLAAGDTEFVLGSAVKHPHDLVLGYYCVHTSAEALSRSAKEIQRIGERLRTEEKIDGAGLQRVLERIRVGNW
jgi:redox-sensitive bicupin YhaK (pirin superfamily)